MTPTSLLDARPIRVFLRPTGLHSRAMVRVASALVRHMPSRARLVTRPQDADLRILHVVGTGSLEDVDFSTPTVVIQYCARSAGRNEVFWLDVWQRSLLVWSYLGLWSNQAFNYYRAPLGVDPAFATNEPPYGHRDIGVVTSGYTAGPGHEAIEEVAIAARDANTTLYHVGPEDVAGMSRWPEGLTYKAELGIPDAALVNRYSRARFVSGLRHVEGFELPVIEGMACGAIPIVFDRPDMRHWYDGMAVFIPESTGAVLVNHLRAVFANPPDAWDSDAAHLYTRTRFDWHVIAPSVWARILDAYDRKRA